MNAKIPPNRLFCYLSVAALLPALIILFTTFANLQNLNQIDSDIESLKVEVLKREKREAINQATKNAFQHADQFYLDNHLEPLRFLKKERESLESLTQSPHFVGDETIKKRLKFLKGNENRLLFINGGLQKYPHFQEALITLAHPVEIDTDDLKKILTKIEGENIPPYSSEADRPHLILLDLRFDRKKVLEANELFFMNLKLLKRDYL